MCGIADSEETRRNHVRTDLSKLREQQSLNITKYDFFKISRPGGLYRCPTCFMLDGRLIYDLVVLIIPISIHQFVLT